MWGALIPAAVSLLGGLFAGKKSKKAATNAAGGATLANLMPQIQAMLAQQQNVQRQNYGNQLSHSNANQPLQDAVRQMAMRIMPPR
jgi:hypothetical protein